MIQNDLLIQEQILLLDITFDNLLDNIFDVGYLISFVYLENLNVLDICPEMKLDASHYLLVNSYELLVTSY